jgi:hypothetical protein
VFLGGLQLLENFEPLFEALNGTDFLLLGLVATERDVVHTLVFSIDVGFHAGDKLV